MAFWFLLFLVFMLVFVCVLQDIEAESYMLEYIKNHLNPNSMIKIDYLGESSVLNLLISYFEDNAMF